MEGLEDKSMGEIAAELKNLIEKYYRDYLQRKKEKLYLQQNEDQFLEAHTDNAEMENQEKEDQYCDDNTDKLEVTNQREDATDDNGENQQTEEYIEHLDYLEEENEISRDTKDDNGKNQQTEEYIEHFDYVEEKNGIPGDAIDDNGENQQTEEYIEHFDYFGGNNEGNEMPGKGDKTWDQYNRREKFGSGTGDHIKYLKKRGEKKRKKGKKGCPKATRKKKIERLRSRGWKIKMNK